MSRWKAKARVFEAPAQARWLYISCTSLQLHHAMQPPPTSTPSGLPFLLQEGRQTHGTRCERATREGRRGHPLPVAANGTSHSSSPTSNLAPSTSTLTHRHQPQWWHHPQTLKGIYKPSLDEADSSGLREKGKDLAASTSSTSLNRWSQIQRMLGLFQRLLPRHLHNRHQQLVSLSDSIGLNCSNHPGKPW